MNHIADCVSNRIEQIESEVNLLKAANCSMPSGHLRTSRQGNSVRYYHVTEKGDPTGIYIRKGQNDLIESLAQKSYNQKLLKKLEMEKKILKQAENLYRMDRNGVVSFMEPEKQIWSQTPEERKKYIIPIVADDARFVEEWCSEQYSRKGFQDDAPEYYTEKGIRVRSKTEWMIAEMLDKKQIPYYYEKPLALRGIGVIHPDFTVLNVRKRKTLFWEHMGMMGDEEYRSYALERIGHYELSGYFPGTDLILTHESSARPIRSKILERVIEHYLL